MIFDDLAMIAMHGHYGVAVTSGEQDGGLWPRDDGRPAPRQQRVNFSTVAMNRHERSHRQSRYVTIA